MLKTHRPVKTDVFFYWFYCLLIITTNAITKANAMIVTDTRPVKSNFINNNISISTIRLTSSYVGGKPHLFVLISYKLYYILFCYKLQAFIEKNLYIGYSKFYFTP